MANPKTENREMTRHLRKEMALFTVECGEVQIGIAHGNVSLHGRVRAMKGHEAAFESSVTALLKSLRAQRGVKDVHAEWTMVF